MTVTDDTLRCAGSNHVPGHDPGCDRYVDHEPIAWTRDSSSDVLAGLLANSTVTAILPSGLELQLSVNVVRVGRRRCPRCRRVRVVHRLTAFSDDQPVGYGRSLCAECAGWRVRRP